MWYNLQHLKSIMRYRALEVFAALVLGLSGPAGAAGLSPFELAVRVPEGTSCAGKDCIFPVTGGTNMTLRVLGGR